MRRSHGRTFTKTHDEVYVIIKGKWLFVFPCDGAPTLLFEPRSHSALLSYNLAANSKIVGTRNDHVTKCNYFLLLHQSSLKFSKGDICARSLMHGIYVEERMGASGNFWEFIIVHCTSSSYGSQRPIKLCVFAS